LSGFRRDAWIAWLYGHFHFKAGVAVSLALWGIGLLVATLHVPAAIRTDEPVPCLYRWSLFGLCCIVNGLQLSVTSYLTSIMALPRHADALPSEAEDTGLVDLP
jgi:hypothetical protein